MLRARLVAGGGEGNRLCTKTVSGAAFARARKHKHKSVNNVYGKNGILLVFRRCSLFYVYVIENQTPNRFYIGYTCNLESRIAEHMLGVGAIWTSVHGFKRVIHTEEYYWKEDAKDRERELTLDYINKYGIENVAGGRYTQLRKGNIRGARIGW